MDPIAQDKSGVQVRLSLDDLLVLGNALNEVCNALEVPEFATRMGVERDYAAHLLRKINALYDDAIHKASI